ncbi:MAG: SDR family NAD(P)-dependent oxidoreductase [Deltaproteobacteria bacterium]|nr:SDR family NAD(P)-dependent oxidoreductase [Deltaproteobacteria bacterium]MBW2359376.1 SDR family NAD(P)-dependent oxidoreductase [Deltaproteobacteria bacterium]
MDLAGAVAVVTGAARGIGRGTAVMLAEAGAAAVVLVDVKAEQLTESAALVKAAGAEPVISVADVASLDELRRVFAEVDSRFGRLDVLFNNAGIGEGATDWPGVAPERAAAIVDVNLRGVVLGTQLALEPMRRSGGGVVVNTSSGAAHAPLPPQAVYAATKAGVVHFTKSCAPLAETHGVRVNCVCPGLVETQLLLQDTGGGKIPAWLQPLVDSVELLAPEDIGRVVLDFIADDSKIAEIVTVENRER